jgi:hypothetical protein
MAETCGFCLSAYPGKVDRFGQHICGVVRSIPERTPDGHLELWLLYRPEPFEFDSDDDRSIHLWVRRCDVFTSRAEAIAFLDNLTGRQILWEPHELFPELWIGKDGTGRWLLESAPLNPPGRTV